MNFATVMSGLALLAATISLALSVYEKKRNQKRNAALCDLIEEERKKIVKRLEALEEGVVPDYEAAQKAADSLNDFNRGIASIMGFDPFEVIRSERDKNRTGVEDDE